MYFLDCMWTPIGSCKHFATCITGVDQANVEGVIRQKYQFFACTAPDKARILTHRYLWERVTDPYGFVITKGVTDGQLPDAIPAPWVFVEPCLIVGRIVVQLATGPAQVCPLTLQHLYLITQPMRSHPVIVIPMYDDCTRCHSAT